jgi:hypothetical protein
MFQMERRSLLEKGKYGFGSSLSEISEHLENHTDVKLRLVKVKLTNEVFCYSKLCS